MTGKLFSRRCKDLGLIVLLTLLLCQLTGIKTPWSRLQLTSAENLTKTAPYQPQDLLISQQIRPWELKAQDRILIHHGDQLVPGQITEITHDGRGYTLSLAETKTAVQENMLEAKVLFALPHLGFIAKYQLPRQLQNPLLILLAFLATIALCRSLLANDAATEAETVLEE